jgi:MFS family permease
MIAGTYLASAAMAVVLAVLFRDGSLTTWSFMPLLLATFFFASAGASSAYLTVSEVFPMETRALAIALFYATGTAVGGIAGPMLFGQFIESGDADLVALGFLIGAAAMALGGVAELRFGVRAEQRSLESIATPLTAEEADADAAGVRAGEPGRPTGAPPERIRQRTAARRERDRSGLRRFRPGPGSGSAFYSPGMVGTAGTASRSAAMSAVELDREIEALAAAVRERGELAQDELARLVGAQGWGPGRYRVAVLAAVAEGRMTRIARHVYGPPARTSGEPGGGVPPTRGIPSAGPPAGLARTQRIDRPPG